MSAAQAQAHQERHGFVQPKAEEQPQPKPRQNKTEAEYGLILEAMKRRGEILEYRYEGIKLAWGADPKTGRQMYYTPDFYIVGSMVGDVTLAEVKGSHIYPQDWIRFKGCRAEWPMFRFELWQRKEGQWTRLL